MSHKISKSDPSTNEVDMQKGYTENGGNGIVTKTGKQKK
jgi:hypothetical protein